MQVGYTTRTTTHTHTHTHKGFAHNQLHAYLLTLFLPDQLHRYLNVMCGLAMHASLMVPTLTLQFWTSMLDKPQLSSVCVCVWLAVSVCVCMGVCTCICVCVCVSE